MFQLQLWNRFFVNAASMAETETEWTAQAQISDHSGLGEGCKEVWAALHLIAGKFQLNTWQKELK